MADIQSFLWLLAFGIGAWAAWLDWRSHKVPNFVWLTGLGLAAPLLLVEVFKEPVEALIRWGCFLGFFAVMWTLWRAGTFGAADAKGLSFFALILSPIGYFDLWHGKIYPALDVLVTSLLLAEVFRWFSKRKNLPFYTVSFGPLALAPVAGGLVWWPLLTSLRFFL